MKKPKLHNIGTKNKHQKKAKFVQSIFERLAPIKGVVSVTVTGSFVEKQSIYSGIRDIDVVVITKTLNKTLFSKVINNAKKCSPEILGLKNYNVLINETFGPRKISEPKKLVLHIMVYDLKGHLRHTQKSPLTCYDWERSSCFSGIELRRISPVIGLNVRSVLKSRRGILNYLKDLKSGYISYRVYKFHSKGYREVVRRQALDQIHKTEFCYHIVKNLVNNYYKVIAKKNVHLKRNKLNWFWFKHLVPLKKYFVWFEKLAVSKNYKKPLLDKNLVNTTKDFCNDFSSMLQTTWFKDPVVYYFMRHAKTSLNNGRFLGQRLDPPIKKPASFWPLNIKKVYSSPSRRCRETAFHYAKPHEPCYDARLSEIDYGDAEGLDTQEFATRFPKNVSAWQRGEDPSFPGGESSEDVIVRLNSFLKSLKPENSLIVTHNVVLRCLLGQYLNLPSKIWHRIPVAYQDPIEVQCLAGATYLNLRQDQSKRIAMALFSGKRLEK